jgi:hypothetical protein
LICSARSSGIAAREGCVDGAIKYVRAKRERLFDRAADPTERTDLAARGDPRAPALRRRLDTMLAEPAATLEPTGIELSEEDRARFRQLGYVESSLLDFSKRPDFTTLEDPEDHRELIQKLESVNQAFAEQRPDESIRLLREICQAAPAGHYMRRERPGHALQTTALLNEAYVRLIDWKNVRWQNRAHFFGVAAQMMRRILVDFARERQYLKRGGSALQVSLSEKKGSTVTIKVADP